MSTKQLPPFYRTPGEYYQIKDNPNGIETVKVRWGEAKVLPYNEKEKIVIQLVWEGGKKHLRIGELKGREENSLKVVPLGKKKKAKLKELLGLDEFLEKEIKFWEERSETEE